MSRTNRVDGGTRDSRQIQPFAIQNGLAIYAVGSGPPLLLMPYPHANSVVGDASMSRMIERLAHLPRRVITFDPPGSGRSTRALRLDMAEMIACAVESLDACGVDRAVDVWGHSQGGVAALAFALDHRARVGRLMLICTASGAPAYFRAPGAIWNRTHPSFWRFGALATLYWLTGRRAAETAMLNLIFRDSYVDRSRFTPAPIAWRDWLRPARPRTRWGQIARRLDYSARLVEVSVPTLVVAGRYDPQMPPSCAEELARGIRDSRLRVFAQSGHYPFIEEAESFWPLIGAFLETTHGEDVRAARRPAVLADAADRV
jgi:pimeloyl-ACP methyl ester carboxylesterase